MSKPRAAIAIFVKTPTLSPIKTRLAQSCGSGFAERFFMLSAAAVKEVSWLTKAPVYWAVAESGLEAEQFWGGEIILQGQGGLGTRMWTVMQQLIQWHGAGILLGADTPQIELVHLQPAIEWLQNKSARQCLGLATDGGFWCYGQNRNTPESLWTGVPYSTPHTAVDFQKAMASQGAMRQLAELTDVDQQADLAPCWMALTKLRSETPMQRVLRRWLGMSTAIAHTKLPATETIQ